eukprot:1490673-Amphidinium_carterae.1
MQICRETKAANSTLISEKCRRCVDLEQKLERKRLTPEQQRNSDESKMEMTLQPGDAAQQQLLEAMKEADLELLRVLETIPRHHLVEIKEDKEKLPPIFVAGGGPVRHVQRAQQDQKVQLRIESIAKEKIADFLNKERSRKQDHPQKEDDGQMTSQEF